MSNRSTIICSATNETSIEKELENGARVKISVVNLTQNLPTEPCGKSITVSVISKSTRYKDIADYKISELLALIKDHFKIEEEICDFCGKNRMCFHMYTSFSKGNDDKLNICKRCFRLVSQSMKEFFEEEV